MTIALTGRARRLGDNINTDYIIASTRKRDTIDESALKQYLLESVDPAFAASVRPGDMLAAGRNFGCGSAMEIAATVILAAGIKAVLAESFSRTFYRNAINNGLLAVACDTSTIREGDELSVRLVDGRLAVEDLTNGVSMSGPPLPHVMLEILGAGGLVPYIRQQGAEPRIHTD
jgi:3-isopropylmalate/(R)-2-methylmalate dehydratase small subunit